MAPRSTGAKVCLICVDKKPKPIVEFGINARCKDGRQPSCKKCFSMKESVRQIEAKAKEAPDKYMTCNECDRTFSKNRPGPVPRLGACMRKPEKCPFCNSKSIEDYV